ncbi:MAG TPA: nitroreductase family protein [Phycisphaerae bacterium]|nr:nitroreductase family protein [Phycisphaerae bacterium]HPS52991.1 nitroreductase family protein [Phycisphaerae bacterium]
MIAELVKKNRSYRRFAQNSAISHQTLVELVDLARNSASAANLQPLKYFISCDPATNEKIFPTMFWAGYLKDWDGPDDGERPAGYIVLLGDTTISQKCDWDAGIACQSILLGAVEKGFGGCILGSINRNKLREVLRIPDYLEIVLIIALGKPVESVTLETAQDGQIKYYRDDSATHHVPKRPLEEILWQPE